MQDHEQRLTETETLFVRIDAIDFRLIDLEQTRIGSVDQRLVAGA